jgi:competence protein ComEA
VPAPERSRLRCSRVLLQDGKVESTILSNRCALYSGRIQLDPTIGERDTCRIKCGVVDVGQAGNHTSLEILAGFPRTTQMTLRRLLSVAALLALSAAPALAQTAAPAQPTAPAVAAPAKPATPVAAAPIAKKINLNTATVTELDGLPQVGPNRAKAIMDARAKGTFKNWDDFVARKVVPSNVEAAIKDKVTF